MSESERLKKLLIDYPCMSTAEDNFIESIAADLADYLLANGVIVPPCKVGDTVYIITDKNKIVKRIVRTFRFLDDLGYEFECTLWEKDRKGLSCLKTNIIHSEELGKTVFLSREEAEKALAERSNR